ncbi:MAG: hypothetical protein JJT81_08760 [Rubellimicrobium sp.]|nr:hypothetical protein [Rubellimicrobium sp.]
MPNLIASAALAIWPVVTAVLFIRLPPGRALIASLLTAYLFLPPPPAGFEFPLRPLDKDSIPVIAAGLAGLFVLHEGRSILPKSRLALILVAGFLISPTLTVLTNSEPVTYGLFTLPGLGISDILANTLEQIFLITPFLLARHFLSRLDDLRDLLWALVIGGLIYSLPMLIEIRLSPQLNTWIYGYFQHLFDQMVRGDGFRPIVFLYHGLWVAFFALMSVLATAALYRSEPPARRKKLGVVLVYLLAVLILCRSMASIFYALTLVPVILVLSPRVQLHLALMLAVIALAYPIIKGTGQLPSERIIEMAAGVNPDRAESLGFRLANEDILLARAAEKPLFGWGTWGRNQVIDPLTGRYQTVSDGRWVIVIGISGWFGFLMEFGLLTLPIFLMWRRREGLGEGARLVAPACLILAVNIFDLIPNATLTPLTWLFVGALLAYAEMQKTSRRSRASLGEPAFQTVL